MARLSRKERDDLRRRQEILKSAMSIFAAQGFHGTTMATISQESQYPLGTIYKYFSSKKQIYHDLVMEKAQELGQILLAISRQKHTTITEKLREALFSQAAFYRTNNEFIRIYISERSNIDAVVMPTLNQKVNRLHDKMIDLFTTLFEQGVRNGEIKAYSARDMAVLFSDIAHSASWASLFKDENDQELKKRLSMTFDMVANGISTISAPCTVPETNKPQETHNTEETNHGTVHS